MNLPKKSLPFHLQVYDNIKERIIAGQLKCGDKIQEVRLSKELNVSRSPVREAIRMLENDGLIVKRENILIVNPMTYEDTIEVYECRILLESYAAGIAAIKICDSNIAKLEICINNMIEFNNNSEDNYLKIVNNNSKFHRIISEASEHKLIIEYIKKISALSMLSRANEFYVFKRGLEYIDEHINIFNSIKARDSIRTENCVKEHINNDLKFYKMKYEEVNKS
ncbi:MAG: GntR family transcriptional regulator [Sedimentibacter sp.]